MADWGDLAGHVQTACQRVLGEDISYSPAAGGGPFAIRGIFTDNFERVSVVDGAAIISFVPVISVHLADLVAAPLRGDAVTVRTVAYTVREVLNDGEGDADLVLDEV